MPSAKSVTIQTMLPQDSGLYREIRLEGLREHPEAFGASYKDVINEPLSHFQEILVRNRVFGAFNTEQSLVGVVGIRIPTGKKLWHKGTLWGMYIKPEARGNGLAYQLALHAMTMTKEDIEEMLLTVVTSNVTAVHLYKKLGFIEYGMEPRALKVDDQYHDELLMRLPTKQ